MKIVIGNKYILTDTVVNSHGILQDTRTLSSGTGIRVCNSYDSAPDGVTCFVLVGTNNQYAVKDLHKYVKCMYDIEEKNEIKRIAKSIYMTSVTQSISHIGADCKEMKLDSSRVKRSLLLDNAMKASIEAAKFWIDNEGTYYDYL